jgi:hypothetical protein
MVFLIAAICTFDECLCLYMARDAIDKTIHGNIDLKSCFLFLIHTREPLVLFFCLCLLSVLVPVVMKQNRKSYHRSLNPHTPEITTPIPAGENQHGSARWMNQKEKEQYFIGGAGVVIGMEKHHKRNTSIPSAKTCIPYVSVQHVPAKAAVLSSKPSASLARHKKV